jgi:hypothetical protein
MPPDPLANSCLQYSVHTFGDRILSWEEGKEKMGPLAVLPHHWRILKKCTVHTGQAWKICLATVGIEPTTIGFQRLVYSYINTSGNWENEKVCGNTTPRGRSAFTQFRVSPISTSVDIFINTEKCFIFFYNIAQRNIKKEIFRVDIELISTRLLANQRSEFTKAILAIKTSTLKIRRFSL